MGFSITSQPFWETPGTPSDPPGTGGTETSPASGCPWHPLGALRWSWQPTPGTTWDVDAETNDTCVDLYYVYTIRYIYIHIYIYYIYYIYYAYLIIFVYHPYTSAIDLGILWLNPFYCVLSMRQFHRRCNRFISPRITFVFLCSKMDCIKGSRQWLKRSILIDLGTIV